MGKFDLERYVKKLYDALVVKYHSTSTASFSGFIPVNGKTNKQYG